ncbi:hypothetical protein J3Q64DRAFT_1773495 [Phycomyces blakesleeanus]|uniref:Uncharacterized protein n=1 Tax=Phycomyces blakesleeanus TaxID=4837 RepID=A0ABR3AKU6_PHYBL
MFLSLPPFFLPSLIIIIISIAIAIVIVILSLSKYLSLSLSLFLTALIRSVFPYMEGTFNTINIL